MVFLPASVEVRARRRYEESRAENDAITYEKVLAQLRRRDKIDSERDQSPLRPANDAVVIATDDMSVPELTAEILRIAETNGIRPIGGSGLETEASDR